jgi:hypothetical protein
LKHVPQSERAAALKTQAQSWQPFDDTQACCALMSDEGVIVAWDRQLAWQALSLAGFSEANCTLVPETLWRAPAPDGVRLIELPFGVEAQAWEEGRLRASRWWSAEPDAAAWADFQRALPTGMEASARPLLEPAPVWLSRPWLNVLSSDGQGGDAEQRLVWLAGGALAIAIGFVGAQWWAVERASSDQLRRNAELRTQLAPDLADRESALRAATEVSLWSAWVTPKALPVELMSELHEALSPQKVMLRELDWQGERLRLGLQVPAEAPRGDLFKALQGSGWFVAPTEVRSTIGQGLLWVEVTVVDSGSFASKLSVDRPVPTSGNVKEESVAPAAGLAPAPRLAAPPPVPELNSGSPASPKQAAPVATAKPQAVAPVTPAVPHARTPPRPIAPVASGVDFPPQSVFDAVK